MSSAVENGFSFESRPVGLRKRVWSISALAGEEVHLRDEAHVRRRALAGQAAADEIRQRLGGDVVALEQGGVEQVAQGQFVSRLEGDGVRAPFGQVRSRGQSRSHRACGRPGAPSRARRRPLRSSSGWRPGPCPPREIARGYVPALVVGDDVSPCAGGRFRVDGECAAPARPREPPRGRGHENERRAPDRGPVGNLGDSHGQRYGPPTPDTQLPTHANTMNEAAFHSEIAAAQDARRPCALATVVATKGSVPRAPGAKMLVYADGTLAGTVGGGKFEALVIEEALAAIAGGVPRLKTYTLREGEPQSFGAICGGEASVFIEPLTAGEALWIIGGGHCSQAIARLGRECGFYVGVVEDRADQAAPERFPGVNRLVTDRAAPEFIAGREWVAQDALVIVNRHAGLDKLALDAALRRPVPGYVGMMGSRRKVARVFDELVAEGHARADLARVHAPIGLDIGADSPAEIAVSIIAEVLRYSRRREGGGSLRAG